MAKNEFDKLKDDVHYLIVAHCKYKDMSMYDRALKQFQKDINYEQIEEMSYNERFAFLLGFEVATKTAESFFKKELAKFMLEEGFDEEYVLEKTGYEIEDLEWDE